MNYGPAFYNLSRLQIKNVFFLKLYNKYKLYAVCGYRNLNDMQISINKHKTMVPMSFAIRHASPRYEDTIYADMYHNLGKIVLIARADSAKDQ